MTRHSALVGPQWAQERIGSPGTIFVETGNSDDDYRKGHIPGTVWIGWDEFQDDLRLGVIDRPAFEKLLSAKGIGNDDTVVVYSDNGNLLASLTYWYFRLYGHPSVRLLDGGRERWERDGRPLTSDMAVLAQTSYQAREPDMSIRATRDDVLAAIGTANLVDVRDRGEYAGRRFAPTFAGTRFAPGNDPHAVAQRSGHVPGAVNLEWSNVLGEDGTFRSTAELEKYYAELAADRDTITYCWVGARSAHSWFVLCELLGRPGVKNYDGSWAEYGSLVGVPVERGEGTA